MVYILTMALIFVIVGVFQLLYPAKFYMFGRKWMYKGNYELSGAGIFFIRISGVILLGISIYGFYSAIVEYLYGQ
ncbi:DUF6199 family natural product biosynthesis protein [Gudongella sp. DL1XJH-153]|uniref:DUF6199 family natural product biosynthesis protein n=1 Tax=Gudongella sp. DL1XJH-153 TaxID=3409804 RepID=UPI003BB7B5C6